MLKLNLGCASSLLEGYINIDMDSMDTIKHRYPNIEIEETLDFYQGDILNLPYDDNSVDEIRADAILEHMSFLEESLFFYEVRRALKPGGLLNISVPDFDDIVKKWIESKDDWKDFFRNDDEAIKQEHWFGNYSYSAKNRWGYLTASIFGPQNGIGQFHKNAYTVPKIRAIFNKLNFSNLEISNFYWKQDSHRDLMIRAKALKGRS
jgi:ubiquinone/menaquinone biosynthesis C-methylase UbiE